jgi:hypothetical protein
MSVSDLYITRISRHIVLQQNRQTDPGQILISHRYIYGIGRQNILILIWKQGGCTVSFLGKHKFEADIYIGFSSALHLHFAVYVREEKV